MSYKLLRRFVIAAVGSLTCAVAFSQVDEVKYATKLESTEIYQAAKQNVVQNLVVTINDNEASIISSRKRNQIWNDFYLKNKNKTEIESNAIENQRKANDDAELNNLKKLLVERKNKVLAGLPAVGVTVVDDFPATPQMILSVPNYKALMLLVAKPDVIMVRTIHTVKLSSNAITYPLPTDPPYGPMKNYSLPFIGANKTIAEGHRGAGTRVVILDSALLFDQISGYCAPYLAANDNFSNNLLPGVLGSSAPVVRGSSPGGCRIWSAYDFSTGGSNPTNPIHVFGNCPGGYVHGNTDAGIIIAAAPDTYVESLQIASCTTGLISETNVLHALSWLIQNSGGSPRIVAANMSFSIDEDGKSGGSCTVNETPYFAQLLNAGIIPVVSTGNNGWRDGVSAPACSPGILPVSAVSDSGISAFSFGYPANCSQNLLAAGTVPCFANVSQNINFVYAPGVLIQTSVTAAGTGTSQAAPFVAAEVAVIKGNDVAPSKSTTDVINLISSNGTVINSPVVNKIIVNFDQAVAKSMAPALGHLVLQPNAQSIAVGANTSFSVTAYDTNGNVITTPFVNWTTTNPNVASVTANGTVRGVATGTASIAATSGASVGVANITVQPAVVTSMSLQPNPVTVLVGIPQAEQALAYDQSGNAIQSPAITWSVQGAGLSIDQSGILSASVYGTTGIVNAVSGSVIASATLTVPAKITVGPPKCGRACSGQKPVLH